MKLLLARLLLLAALGVSAAHAVGPETFHFRSGDLVVQLTPDLPGGTLRLPLGPVGELTWKTHAGIVNVEARFLLGSGAADLPDPEQFRDLRFAILLRKVPWLLAVGALLALLLGDGSTARRLRAIAIGASATTMLAVLAVGVAAVTFDAGALRNPRYRGPIEDVPRVLQLLKEVQRDWAGVTKNINKAVEGLQRLHTQVVTAATVREGDTVKLLAIADVHNNPLGLMVARELTQRFEVDGVLDAGDMTDRGTRYEGELFARFAELGVPHVVAAGNHEDRASLARIAKVPDVTILDSNEADTTTIDGITILGDADPNARSIDSNPFNEVAEREVPLRCQALAARAATVAPQVVLVHDPRLGECAAKQAQEQGRPLVFVWGHLHKPAFEERGSVIAVSPGTSGAAGFKTDAIRPYGFSLLEFDADSKRLASVCAFLFDTPSSLRETSCQIIPEPGSPAARARASGR